MLNKQGKFDVKQFFRYANIVIFVLRNFFESPCRITLHYRCVLILLLLSVVYQVREFNTSAEAQL